jgi:ribonuclease HI
MVPKYDFKYYVDASPYAIGIIDDKNVEYFFPNQNKRASTNITNQELKAIWLAIEVCVHKYGFKRIKSIEIISDSDAALKLLNKDWSYNAACDMMISKIKYKTNLFLRRHISLSFTHIKSKENPAHKICNRHLYGHNSWQDFPHINYYKKEAELATV